MRDENPSVESPRVDRAQYGLAAVLALVGIYTVVDARGLNVGFGDPIGPRVFPYIIGTAMVLLAVVLAVATARGDVPQAEEGEDLDLTTPPDWVTVGKLVAILVINILLVNVLGWAITGAFVFAGSAWALGSRTYLRDVAVGVVLSVGSWYFFYSGLGVPLSPASSTGSCEAAVDTLNLLLDGFASALTLENLLYAAIGVLLGTFVGVLPGIGPAMALALLLPVTYGLDATQALIMFAGIYYGGMYGGSTTSILLNTPGESASVMTAIEGNKMAKKGRAAQALATAAIGSFIAGTIGTLLVAFFTPTISTWAVEIGAPSYFAIMLLAMVLVSSVLGASKLRGFIALAIGLTVGLVGLDASTAQARLTGGWLELADGIDIVVVAVGVFAIGEALWTAAHLRRLPIDVIPVGRPFMGRDDWRRSWGPWLRGTALGFPFGALPAGGAETPTFLSYITERKLAGRRGAHDEFGEGAIEGVAGPEAANNASAAGMFVPLLALGLPVTATASILLAAMLKYGIVPGPTLMTDQPDLIWTLLASLLIGNTLLLVINLPLAPVWARLLRIPRPQLYAGILFFACLGAYSVGQSSFDVALLLVFGGVGLAIRRFGIPVLPLILGVILGPLMEVKMREALDLSGGDISGLFNEPLAIFVYVLVVLAVVVPLLLSRFRPAAVVAHHDQEVS